MASSNIKLFDENKGNMLTDTEFSISNQRMNGLQTGVASSQLQNKAMYQASLIAYAIAQVMMQNGKNANDTDAVSAFVANLSGTMLQKVYDIATTAEAQAGVATGKWMSPALVKTAFDKFWSNTYNNLVLPVSKGGTGLTSAPSLLVNLASTTAASPLTASPRPGVTGTLPVANGGTGQTNLANLMTQLASQGGGCRIQTGSYVGSGSGAERTVTFSFKPMLFWIIGEKSSNGNCYLAWQSTTPSYPHAAYVPMLPASKPSSSADMLGYRSYVWYDTSTNTIHWTSNKDYSPCSSGITYYWIAIG